MSGRRFAVIGLLVFVAGTGHPSHAQQAPYQGYAPDPLAPVGSGTPWNSVPQSQKFDAFSTTPYPNTSTPAPFRAPATGYGSPAPYAPNPGQGFSSGPSTMFPQPAPGYAPPPPLTPAPIGGPFGPGGVFGAPPSGPYMRFFQAVRLRHTYIYANETDEPEVSINDSEFNVTAAFPNFLFRSEPLMVTPGFALHFWDGPSLPTAGGSPDLPPRAYSGYIDAAWAPQITPQFGADLALRVGAYTDFQTFTTDSWRITGRGLAVVQLTPTFTLSGGIEYLDRIDIKLLPAGGVLWQPNPQTRFDIYFPRPKLAQYLSTVGTREIWWYVGGEYGGGSWTIERAASGASDQIDINDLRITLGLEWKRDNRGLSYIELGFVFNRKVIYLDSPLDDFRPNDTFMIRGGLEF